MPSDIPYMMQMGNIPKIFERIKEAGTPPKFTHEFLKNSLRFTGSGDRGIIKVLKSLGFLTNDSAPTDRYNRYKGIGGDAELAVGLREGWSAIFLADQLANERSKTALTQIFKSVTGAGEASAMKMAGTFKAIADLADWDATAVAPTAPDERPGPPDTTAAATSAITATGSAPSGAHPQGSLSLSLRHDIHLHLPATSDVAVYTAIFRAIRDELRD